MANIEEQVYALINQSVIDLNLKIYDVEYVKEGKDWYLRVYIDKDGGVDINDCENVSRLIDPMLDEADLIKQAYCLEVSSPGLERTLRKQEHFDEAIGEEIELSLFKAVNDEKKAIGVLKSCNEENIIIEIDGNDISFDRKNVSKVKTTFNF